MIYGQIFFLFLEKRQADRTILKGNLIFTLPGMKIFILQIIGI